MKTYTITKVSGQPDWSKIPVLALDEPYKVPLEETPVRGWAQVAYNDEALLIHQWAKEPNIRKEQTGLLDQICDDSCLEFFFSPMEGDERYFNIEYNLNCCRYLGFGGSITNLIRLIPEENNDEFCPKAAETEDGWEELELSAVEQFTLENAIQKALLERDQSTYPGPMNMSASFLLLGSESEYEGAEKDGELRQITLYGLARTAVFGYTPAPVGQTGGTLRQSGGSHIPTVLTFAVEDGSYTLKEYWIPRDGSLYAADIREKFPRLFIKNTSGKNTESCIFEIFKCFKLLLLLRLATASCQKADRHKKCKQQAYKSFNFHFCTSPHFKNFSYKSLANCALVNAANF